MLLSFYVIIALKSFFKHKQYNTGLVEQVGKIKKTKFIIKLIKSQTCT